MTKPEINHINSIDVILEETTEVMRQYLKIKRENPDCILLYRLGDFYETFFEDAELMSRELQLTLTGKDAGKIGRIPLAGIPVKAVKGYLERLIARDYKVAICEQLEDPKQAKGLVDRGVVRIITAGTLIESEFLNQTANNYICAIIQDKDRCGFAYTDISTGEFKCAELRNEDVLTELARIQPSEIIAGGKKLPIQKWQIVPEVTADLPDEIKSNYNCSVVNSNFFNDDNAQNTIKSFFSLQNLDSIGYDECKKGFRAAAAILNYIHDTMKGSVPRFEKIEHYDLSDFVTLDVHTLKNLELTETLREKNQFGSLFWAINKTTTGMGARLLKSWICQPLKNKDKIISRQNIVKQLFENSQARYDLEKALKDVYDIQRLAARMSNSSASPRDFISLKTTLFVIPKIIKTAQSAGIELFEKFEPSLNDIENFAELIERTIEDNPPITIKEGGIIKAGVNNTLDYLRSLMTNGEEWIRNFEEEEREKTGISTLKVGYNRVFGYYIEVTNSHLNKVPNEYVRRQTLTGAERYITDSLKKHEDEVVTAQYRATELEYKTFTEFREYSKEFVSLIRELSEAISELDVYCSFASVALEADYVCPEIDNSVDFMIKDGRHPVLEKVLPMGTYVSNDLELSSNDNTKPQLMILTGPNMAGKSTYMRQNALIIILAQIGSFVPAAYAKIGIADRIFTRVGASDDLTLGKSTFMVEMSETAYILNNATDKSFILIDEIGRGTSTYDGVAIAWSVAEYIASKIKARCIFATHYHELNVMSKTLPQIKNYRITVAEENGRIEFLRKIVPGGASRSYGIHVAKMAGVPSDVIKHSEELMLKMQKNLSKDLSGRKKLNDQEDVFIQPQLNLF